MFFLFRWPFSGSLVSFWMFGEGIQLKPTGWAGPWWYLDFGHRNTDTGTWTKRMTSGCERSFVIYFYIHVYIVHDEKTWITHTNTVFLLFSCFFMVSTKLFEPWKLELLGSETWERYPFIRLRWRPTWQRLPVDFTGTLDGGTATKMPKAEETLKFPNLPKSKKRWKCWYF